MNPAEGKEERVLNMKRFRDAFEKLLSEMGVTGDTPMRLGAGGQSNCKVAICVLNSFDTVSCQFIRSYRTRGMSTPDYSILQAACAAIASPDAYDPVAIGDEGDQVLYIDAMAGYANPTNELLKEAERVFGKKVMVANVVSIGFGQLDLGKQKHTQLNDMLRRAITDTERVHNDIQNRFQELSIYSRFSVEAIPSISNTVSNTTRIKTAAYLEEALNNQRMDRTVASLQVRNGVKPIKELNSITIVEIKYRQRPAVVPFFIGRQDILDRLHEIHVMRPNSEDKYPAISVLVGLGGSGKTQIALQFAKQFERLNPDLLVFFVDASSEDRIKEDYQAIILVQWFSGTEQTWLIIADNADDPSIDLHPFIPRSPRGHFIITSRNTNQGLMARKHTSLTDALELSESVKLLLDVSGYALNDANIERATAIVMALGYLPLAIVQAAGYIFKHKCLSSYLDIYNESKEDLLSQRAKELPQGYNLSVVTTLEMSFNKLSANAKEILKILSFLHNTSIAHSIIMKAVKSNFFYASGKAKEADSGRFNDIKHESEELCKIFCTKGKWSEAEFYNMIEPCLQYSLLHSTVTEDDHQFYSMHILVQSWLQLQSDSHDGVSPKSLAQRMLLATVDENSSYQYFDVYGTILPHLRAFSGTPHEFATDNILLYPVFFDSGNYTIAHLHLMAYIDMARTQVRRDSPEILQAFCYRTLSLTRLGRYHESLEAGTEAVELCTKALGKEDPLTLRTMHHLASACSSIGEYKRGQELNEEVLIIRKRVFGPEHDDTLKSMHNLAVDYARLGQYQDSQRLQEEELSLRIRVSGYEHPDTLWSMASLAGKYSNLGLYNKAQELNVKVVSLRKKVLGPEHPNTLWSMNSLATNYSDLGLYDKAREMNAEVLSLHKKVLGPEHLDTLRSMSSLATNYSDLGLYDKAREMIAEVLSLRKKTLGPEHPNTLWSMNSLATNYSDLGLYDKAREMNAEVLSLRKKVLGPDTAYIDDLLGAKTRPNSGSA
ncbi:TPR-like protein [Serendipita vermifera]|nr:TPR-like protein [Serendipita vermifera]